MENFVFEKKTLPKPTGVDKNTDPALLTAGRYGTDDMIDIWGYEKTYEFGLRSQAAAVSTLSKQYSDIVPPEHSREIARKANLKYVKPQRIREIELATGHDVIGINNALEEVVSPEAGAHINKYRTSADTTETAKALQLKKALKVYIDDLEILRDILLEKAMEWRECKNMDVTHLYDAVPTFAGRPYIFYAEMLQTGINLLAHFYKASIKGKWADATGNHHSATDAGVDGIKLQEEYCKRLKVGWMDAPAQIPGREFITDIVYGIARSSETMGNAAHYIRWGRSSDVGIFKVPRKKKGSSAMPHKDMVGGNPTVEEQTESFTNYMRGAISSSLSSCRFDYGRDLTASAQDRIYLEDIFKWGDHVTRNLGGLIHSLELIKDRCLERIERTYGTTTSERLVTYLTDRRRTENPLPRSEAHDLAGKLATKAYDEKRLFRDVVLEENDVTSRLPKNLIEEITEPMTFLGQSREIMENVYKKYHGRKTFK